MFSIMNLWGLLMLALILNLMTAGLMPPVLAKQGIKTSAGAKITGVSLLAITVLALVATSWTIAAGKERAMDPYATTPYDAVAYMNTTPVEDEITNTAGSVLLFYRYNDPDSASIYHELNAYMLAKTHVYWVSADSRQGRNLLENYPISDLPSAIYIAADKSGHVVRYLISEDGNLDRLALNQLFEMQRHDLQSGTATKPR